MKDTLSHFSICSLASMCLCQVRYSFDKSIVDLIISFDLAMANPFS